MMLSLLREYVEAANRARQRAQSEGNPHAKQVLQEIEASRRHSTGDTRLLIA
jgi:hypothetical protein